MLAGAENSPPDVMVPHVVPEQPAPETLQVTALLLFCPTVARNCCWPFTGTIANVGETATVVGKTMVTTADACLVASPIEVAVTVTRAGLGIFVGAV
jgi:hypothetical protein